MKRFRKTTVWSVLFSILAGASIFFLIGTGNFLFTVVAGVFVVLASLLRKRETLDSYRDRYEENYGLSENSTTDESDTSEKD